MSKAALQNRRDGLVVMNDGIDLGVPAHILWRGRRWIIVGAAFGLAMGVTLGLILPKTYRAEVVMVPAAFSPDSGLLSRLGGQLGGLASLAGVDLSGEASRKNEALALLKSRAFTQQFIETGEMMPVLFASRWQADSATWKPSRRGPPTADDAFVLFDKRIRRVSEARNTGLITLTIEWRDRELAAAWANRLVAEVNQLGRTRDIRESELSLQYLNRELAKANVVELRDAINRLIESQINKVMLANVREDYLFRVVDPAVASDADHFVRPKRVFLALFGILAGASLAAITLLCLASILSWRSTARLPG
jgi:hypothetical protein